MKRLDEILDHRRSIETAADSFLALSYQVNLCNDFVQYNLRNFLRADCHSPMIDGKPTIAAWENDKLLDYSMPLHTLVDSLLKEVEETRRFIASLTQIYSSYLQLDMQVQLNWLQTAALTITLIIATIAIATFFHL